MSIEFTLINVLCIFLPSVTLRHAQSLYGKHVAAEAQCDESVQGRHVTSLLWKLSRRNKPFLRHIVI